MSQIYDYNFKDFLITKGLMDQTLKMYLFYLGKLDIEELNQESVNKFLLRNNNGVARAFLKNFLEYKNRLDLKIPQQTGKRNKRKDLVEFISREEVNIMFQEMKKTEAPMRNSIMVAITFQGGLRMWELLSLKVGSFRWRKWKENEEEPAEVIILGKRNQKRVINLSPGLMNSLRNYIKKLQALETLEWDSKIFRVGTRTWQRTIERTSKKCLGKRISPHILRHSFAMYAKDTLKWPLERIAKYLGHSSIETTKIYARTTDQEIKESFKEGFC